MPASDAPPAAPRERKLPFKRTVKRKSIGTPTPTNNSKSEPDSIELFRRSALFDKFQQQESATKAQRRKAKNVDEDAGADSEIQAQLLRDSRSASGKARIDSVDRDLKRQCISLSDDEDEPGSRISTQRSLRKSSNASLDRSPSKFREATRKATSATPTRARPKQSSRIRADVIALDSSDDEDYKPPQSRGKAKETTYTTRVADEASVAQPISPHPENSDTDSDSMEPDGTQDDQVAAKFIEEVRERMRQERLARETKSATTETPTPMEVVELFITSHLEGTSNMRAKVHLLQQLGMVKKSWVGYNQKKNMPVPESELNDMFFTWRGNKVYDFTTLASLDIKRNSDGQLYSSRETKRDGFDGWDKVHIEAWTSELFDDYQREKDRERMRQLGELPDEENGTGSNTRTSSEGAFDQALDEESTIDEADIEDMDSIEVHIK
ncbi:hypothetical protein PG994_012083 [Apiospora phragmitis]|uniref:Uncharacterized protein n=1 Tax=Apiospora phragmitis TaxID=2905665 RepID=A0ABR1TUP3_9PEZI